MTIVVVKMSEVLVDLVAVVVKMSKVLVDLVAVMGCLIYPLLGLKSNGVYCKNPIHGVLEVETQTKFLEKIKNNRIIIMQFGNISHS